MTKQKTPSSSRLQFTDEERASPELEKYIKRSDKAADRLDAKNAALPKKKKLARERTFDEATGKAKTRLHFEEQDKPPNYSTGKRKISLFRPVTQAELYVHGKIHEVEKDNSGVEAAHRSASARGCGYPRKLAALSRPPLSKYAAHCSAPCTRESCTHRRIILCHRRTWTPMETIICTTPFPRDIG